MTMPGVHGGLKTIITKLYTTCFSLRWDGDVELDFEDGIGDCRTGELEPLEFVIQPCISRKNCTC